MWTPPPSHSAIRIPPAFLAFTSNTKHLKSNIAALALLAPLPALCSRRIQQGGSYRNHSSICSAERAAADCGETREVVGQRERLRAAPREDSRNPQTFS